MVLGFMDKSVNYECFPNDLAYLNQRSLIG